MRAGGGHAQRDGLHGRGCFGLTGCPAPWLSKAELTLSHFSSTRLHLCPGDGGREERKAFLRLTMEPRSVQPRSEGVELSL